MKRKDNFLIFLKIIPILFIGFLAWSVATGRSGGYANYPTSATPDKEKVIEIFINGRE